jgi:hypothetical protein
MPKARISRADRQLAAVSRLADSPRVLAQGMQRPRGASSSVASHADQFIALARNLERIEMRIGKAAQEGNSTKLATLYVLRCASMAKLEVLRKRFVSAEGHVASKASTVSRDPKRNGHVQPQVPIMPAYDGPRHLGEGDVPLSKRVERSGGGVYIRRGAVRHATGY